MTAAIRWDDFWPMLLGMAPETQLDAARQLGLDTWLPTRSPAVVADVLGGAPLPVVGCFLHLLPPETRKRLAARLGLPERRPTRLLPAGGRSRILGRTRRQLTGAD